MERYLQGSRAVRPDVILHHAPLTLVPELVLVGHVTSAGGGDLPLPSHMHQALEVSYLEAGSVNWWVRGQWHQVMARQVFLTLPLTVHAGSPGGLERCRMTWMQVRIPDDLQAAGILGLSPTETRELVRELTAIEARALGPVLPEVGEALRRLMVAVAEPAQALSASRARAAALDCLLLLVDEGRRVHQVSPLVQQSIETMRSVLDRRLPVELLAHDVGLSATRLQALFRREVGASPADYHLRLRIDEATRRLRAGRHSISDIAHDLGFPSSQHFATMFKRVSGVTPTSIRAMPEQATDPEDLAPFVWDLE